MDGIRQAVPGEGDDHRRRNAAEPEGGIFGSTSSSSQSAQAASRGRPHCALAFETRDSHPAEVTMPTLTFSRARRHDRRRRRPGRRRRSLLRRHRLAARSSPTRSSSPSRASVSTDISSCRRRCETARGAVVSRVAGRTSRRTKASSRSTTRPTRCSSSRASIRERYDFTAHRHHRLGRARPRRRR